MALCNLVNLARLHIVDEASHRRVFPNERRGADEIDIVTDTLLEVTEGQEINVGGVRPQLFLADAIQGWIIESHHAAVGVMDHQNFLRPEQTLRDNERA